jgi:hypothetical protein
MLSVMR